MLHQSSMNTNKPLTIQLQLTMNINQGNAEKFYNIEGKPAEEKVQIDPVNELNPISLLKKPDQFKEAFFSMTTISSEAFKSKNYQRSALALTKCVDMLDLGKNILKDINRFWKIVIYANLACCYHYTRKLSKCNKFCEKIKDQLERILTDGPEKEVFLKLSRVLIKLKFQHCAILSQLQQHEKAFQLCKSTLPMIKQCIQMLLTYVHQNTTSDVLEKKSTETVQFSRQVYRFAQNLLNDLLKCLNEPLKSKQRTVFYYWQKNPEQNEQQVKKKFIPHNQNSNCKRSILGVSKSTHWIDQFNIGTIMHFSQMCINDFESSVPMEEYLFKDRLYQMVIYCSMAHFTMATELRLIESTQQDKTEKDGNAVVHLNLMKKYGYQEKSQLYKLSQIYHLRSIDIMSRNIKTTVPYITHIIRSYEKHYIKQKKVLEPIAAIFEESALSLNESKDEKQPKEQSVYYETNYNNFMYKNCENILEKNDYAQVPCKELLLESQKYGHVVKAPLQEQEHQALISEVVQSIGQHKEHVQQVKKELLSVKSANNLLKTMESPGKEELNTSGEYLKSQKTNRNTSKCKKIGIRDNKSSGKVPIIKSIYTSPRESKKQPKIKANEKKHEPQKMKQSQKVSDAKQKTDRFEKNKERQQKNIKKQKEKFLEFDHEKYGEKQIKIKTESCTHIKVTYKKKK